MHMHDENEIRLKRQLRREARRSQPAFSEALHARLLAAISAEETQRPVAAAANSPRFLRGQLLAWMATAAAAIVMTCALSLFCSGFRLSHGDTISRAGNGDGRTRLGPISENASPQNGMVGIALPAEGQWAGLDRDAQAALAAVAGPLPFDLTFSLAQDNAR